MGLVLKNLRSTIQQQRDPKYDVNALVTDLKSSGKRRELRWGRRIHAKTVQARSGSNMFVVTAAIIMYAKCGSMVDAHRLFDTIQNPNVVSWTALLQGYAENGEGHAALSLFSRMKAHGCTPTSVTYIVVLKACISLAVSRAEHALELGRQIQSEIGCHLDHYVQSTLIVMYAKCGSMVDAHRVFDSIQNPDVVSWTALLLGYAENGDAHAALDLLSRMKARGCPPDCVTYAAALKAWTSLAVNGNGSSLLERGRQIHLEIGSKTDRYVQNALIDMYSKCGSMVEARQVFDSVQNPDVVSWNALLMGYAENGEENVALSLFYRMKAARVCELNTVTYIAALKACASLAFAENSEKADCLAWGRQIHLEIGSNPDHYVQSTLVDMYAKCGSMSEARQVFDSIQTPTVVSWNALLLGHVLNGEGRSAMDLFARMKAETGCTLTSVTYIAALKACASLAVNEKDKAECLERGREIHMEIGCNMNDHLRNTLIYMYCKCNSMVDARQVFDSAQNPSVVAWSALMSGYAENGMGLEALHLFSRMKAYGCAPDSITYVAALKACIAAVNENSSGKPDNLELGREMDSQLGYQVDMYVQSTLIDMYAKCGSMVDARRVFDSIQKPDVVSWTAVLLGYAQNGDGHTALELLSQMKASGCAPNCVTYIAALKACALTGALALGRKLHSEIRKFSAPLVASLVQFYAKCGNLTEACEAFHLHSGATDVSTWTALLAAYASFGDTSSVFKLLEAMDDVGARPNAVTFVSVLLCCSHAGLVKKAREYFEAMPVQYGVPPNAMHYTCMVDALGRANQLNEAMQMIRSMPCSPQAVTWSALLGACCKWKNVEVGRMAFQALVAMDKSDSFAHVLMSQTYSSSFVPENTEDLR